MNAFLQMFIYTAMVYGVFVDGTFWKIYITMVAAYTAWVLITRNSRDNPKRKTIMISTWNGKLKVDVCVEEGSEWFSLDLLFSSHKEEKSLAKSFR